MYHLLPKTILKRTDKTRKRFFWQGRGTKKKYFLVKWCKIAKPKRKGDQEIKDLRKMNMSLLCRWWWKIEKGEGLWQEIVKKKYIKQSCILQLKKKRPLIPLCGMMCWKWKNFILKVDSWWSGMVKKLISGEARGVTLYHWKINSLSCLPAAMSRT